MKKKIYKQPMAWIEGCSIKHFIDEDVIEIQISKGLIANVFDTKKIKKAKIVHRYYLDYGVEFIYVYIKNDEIIFSGMSAPNDAIMLYAIKVMIINNNIHKVDITDQRGLLHCIIPDNGTIGEEIIHHAIATEDIRKGEAIVIVKGKMARRMNENDMKNM